MQLNRTELHQICEEANLSTRSDCSPVELQRVLDGEQEPRPNPMHRVRLSLMQFILDHWNTVRSQLSCPAKSGDPRSCFKCHDMQVVACVSDQPQPTQSKILHGTEETR